MVGLLVEEVEATLKHLASLLAAKWQQPYLQTCGYVKSINTITLVRSTHHCIRVLRVQWWVAHTNVMAFILFTYPQVCK